MAHRFSVELCLYRYIVLVQNFMYSTGVWAGRLLYTSLGGYKNEGMDTS